ncbi:hypothetical protein [uncultured Hyphomonas sp.]|uniref:S10 family peptidase n=1 Tax=uncultured Hyphomonas sp. TaxID=225298 RepID=UPI002AAC44F8|nr:hypothetical protein [uncultured Hyphomonas sp.]
MRLFTALCASLVGFAYFSISPAIAQPSVSSQEQTEEPTKTTTHNAIVGGKKLNYEVTAGRLTLTNEKNTPTAKMFYVAYTVPQKQGEPQRPVTFLYNGGPGSSSIWLHMGGLAPIVVESDMPDATAPAPYTLKTNPSSILDKTDLVFLDAIGTGYSRLLDQDAASDYYGIDADANAFTQAIQRYLTTYNRWNAPKFLLGESYGGPRSGVLSYKLQQAGIQLNGIVLLSPIMNFSQHAAGLDRHTVNLMPTYAATGYYHGKTPRHPEGLEGHVEDARQFALGAYTTALTKGHHISEAEANSVATELARLTGLSKDFWLRTNLRLRAPSFTAELLRDEGKYVGNMDARAVGSAPNGVSETSAYDPAGSMSPAYISLFHSYLAETLGYTRDDLQYKVGNSSIMANWDWSHKPPGAPYQYAGANSTIDLAAAMRKNPQLKILALSGYFDMVTPFFATEWDLSHMLLDESLIGNITEKFYEGGHMFYVNMDELKRMDDDLEAFYSDALGK